MVTEDNDSPISTDADVPELRSKTIMPVLDHVEVDLTRKGVPRSVAPETPRYMLPVFVNVPEVEMR